jgi:hypothetical protein
MGCGLGLGFSFLSWVLHCDVFLVQGDCKGLELIKIIQVSSDQVMFDFILEAIVEYRGHYVGVSEFGLQDNFFA